MAQRTEAHRPSPLVRAFALFLLLSGIVLYLSWGALYNAWTDTGLYAVTIMLIGMGGAGYLLHSPTGEPGADE